MWEELENALEWFGSAPNRWYSSAKSDLAAAAEWVWEVLQGDFNDDQSTAQIATGTVISMIPFVDQLCDVRDVVANCKKINAEPNNNWHWVALVLTLIGLFPVLGSLVKGCFKVLFAYGRKAMFGAGRVALDAGMWKACQPYVEAGISKLNGYLARPEVRKSLKALKIDNIYKHLANELRKVSTKLNTTALTKAMDAVISTLNSLLDLVKKWGTAAMKTKAGHLLSLVKRVRAQANAKLGEALKPTQDFLNRLARRLEIEADTTFRADLNTVNPHAFLNPSLTAELAAFKKRKPDWVDIAKKGKNPPLRKAPIIPEGYPNIATNRKGSSLNNSFTTFNTARTLEIPPGTTLYRIVDPTSKDNSICWITKSEFDKLKSKNDWRRSFAVWNNWNSNGEFVTYVVPPGKPLKVWEGITGSQNLINTDYWLEGGARQIVLDPADLNKSYIGNRQATGWGYGSFGSSPSMVGVPQLRNNWFEKK